MSRLRSVYDAKVAAGEIVRDPRQISLIERMEKIQLWLENTSRRRSCINTLFSKTPLPPKGLYIWGEVGRGKSMLMDLFFAATRIERKRRVHFHAFMQEVQAGLEKARHAHAGNPVVQVATGIATQARLLCFDEMQVHDIADAMIIGQLFQALFRAGTLVVITSNRRPDDLYRNGLNRGLFLPFIALLENRLEVRHLLSPKDYRQTQRLGARVFFAPVTASARAQIDHIWYTLAGTAARPLELTVNGREVTLPAFHDGVARASFWELCGAPLGPADYLAIAAAVRVLVLDEIPHLGRANFNEAKRFVTLIDALYEAKVRLIASAADVPERLYVEGEGSFEFARTASRLREMQSAEWSKP